MSADLLAGLLAGLAVAMPIGAIGTYLIGLAARAPFRIAVAAALGVATTDGAYALVAGLGIAGVERVVGAVAAPLRLVAALLLVALAVRTLVLAVRRARTDRPGRVSPIPADAGSSALRTYALLLGLTAVNPATVVTFGAVVVGHQLAGSPELGAATVFALGAFAASATWQVLLVGGGSLLGRLLSGARGQLAVASVSAAAMLVLAAVTLIS